MKVKLVEKLNLPKYLIEADLYESDYHKLLTQELQDKIFSNPELREKVKKGIIDSEIVKLVEDEKDIKAILTNRDLDTDQVFPELMEKYLRLLHLPLGKDETALVIAELSREDPDRIFDNDVPFLEFIKNIANKVADLDYDVLRLIKELNKSGDITNLDLRNPSSWIASDNIWKKERKASDQIYKIKLKVFLSDSGNVKKFKTTAGEALPQNLADWNIASEETAAKLKALYSKYNSDAYDKEEVEKQKISSSLSTFIEENKWESFKIRDNLINIINNTKILIDNRKKDIIAKLKEIFSNRSDLNAFMTNVRIPKDVAGTPDKLSEKHKDIIANAINKYLNSKSLKLDQAIVKDKITFKDYLKSKNLTEEEGFREIGKYLTRLQPKDIRDSYIKAFKRIWEDKTGLRKDFLSATLSIDSKGHFQWAKSLKKYIDNIQNIQQL